MLEHHLAPLTRLLARKGLAELMCNSFGEVWLEFDGRAPVKEKAPELDRAWWERLARIISNEQSVIDFTKKPYLPAILPGGHRLQLCLGDTVRSGIAAGIRVWRPRMHTIEDFGFSAEQIARVREHVELRRNILISGGTFSGKTGLMNALAKLVSPADRIITAEDTPELTLDHLPNRVEFIVNRLATHEDVGYRDVIDAVTRLRPDRFWCGEMSVGNSWILLRMLNTGHGGLITTIHADSPDLAFAAIVRNIQLAGFPTDGVEAFVRDTVHCVVQVPRQHGTHHRRVGGIYERDCASR